jgi:hypothetical protein
MNGLMNYITPLISVGLQSTVTWRENQARNQAIFDCVFLYAPADKDDYIIAIRMNRFIGATLLDLLRNGFTLENVLGEFLYKAFMQSNGSKSGQVDHITGNGMLAEDIQGNDVILSLTLDTGCGDEILNNVYF